MIAMLRRKGCGARRARIVGGRMQTDGELGCGQAPPYRQMPIADGSNLQRITDGVDAVWSPDGDRITFVSRRDGQTEVYVMDADGANQINLTKDSDARDERPSWSPDGDKVVFIKFQGGNSDIMVVNADGSDLVNLTNDGGGVAASDGIPLLYQVAVWSPDGKQIAYELTNSSRSRRREASQARTTPRREALWG